MAALLLGLMILPPGRLLAAQAQTNSPQRDLEVLRRLEEEYLRAEIEDDTAIAGTILADDYVGLRAGWLNFYQSGCPEPSRPA